MELTPSGLYALQSDQYLTYLNILERMARAMPYELPNIICGGPGVSSNHNPAISPGHHAVTTIGSHRIRH